ncbi:MAG: hypothetical protein IJ265_04800 [Oscillospiraceae bacterium]|nr:hypothetical protein [Oscillospiraceae bacterium]
MIRGKFAVLGTEGAGKSVLISRFFHQLPQITKLTTKVQNYNLLVSAENNHSDDMFRQHTIEICHGSNTMINLEISDYSGKMLCNATGDCPNYQKLCSSIYSADVLYVLVDGSLFLVDSTEKRIKNLKRKCARFITPFLSGYAEKNDNKEPMTIFVVTKCQQVLAQIPLQNVHGILKQVFNNAFDSENTGKTEPYTICLDTSTDTAVHIPFLTGMYYLLYQFGLELKAWEDRENQVLSEKISNRQRMIWDNEQRNFISKALNKRQMQQYEAEISAFRREKAHNTSTCKSHSVWQHIPIMKSILEAQLWDNREYMVTDFRKGVLPIAIKEPPKKKTHKRQKYSVGGAILAIVLGFFSAGRLLIIGPIAVGYYFSKRKWIYSILLILVQIRTLLLLRGELAYSKGVFIFWIIAECLLTLLNFVPKESTNKKQ